MKCRIIPDIFRRRFGNIWPHWPIAVRFNINNLGLIMRYAKILCRNLPQFLAALIVSGFFAAAIGTCNYRASDHFRDNRASDLTGDVPGRVPPLVARILLVDPADARKIGTAIHPPNQKPLTSSFCVHVLRANGVDSLLRSKDARTTSGRAIMTILTDARAGEDYFGHAPFAATRSGLRYPTASPENVQGWMEMHRDHTLASFGELGIPLSHPLATIQGGRQPLREVLRDSIANFHLKQRELTWTALAYALYLPPVREWTNRYQEHYSFDGLVTELLDRPLDKGGCGAIHVLYALTVIERVNRGHRILDEARSRRLRARLLDSAKVIERIQRADGSWPAAWVCFVGPPSETQERSPAETMQTRLLVTGHLAEWMLYLPDDIRPPRETIARAGRWLLGAVTDMTETAKEVDFCPATHAVCAVRQMSVVHSGGSVRSAAAE